MGQRLRLKSTSFVRPESVETPSPCCLIQQHSRFRKYVFTKTALVLDDDLGCVFALSLALVESCCTAIPAHTVQEARALIIELRARVDLLIVNVAVPDVQAFSLQLESENPNLIIIQLTASRRGKSKTFTISPSAFLQESDSTQAAIYWIGTLRKALRARKRKERSFAAGAYRSHG